MCVCDSGVCGVHVHVWCMWRYLYDLPFWGHYQSHLRCVSSVPRRNQSHSIRTRPLSRRNNANSSWYTCVGGNWWRTFNIFSPSNSPLSLPPPLSLSLPPFLSLALFVSLSLPPSLSPHSPISHPPNQKLQTGLATASQQPSRVRSHQ